MNERMIELHKQAAEFAYKTCKEEEREGRPGWETEYIRNTITTSKFAELIVRECSDISNQAEKQCQHPGTMIKQHFGVE
jgi:hypothetical protein